MNSQAFTRRLGAALLGAAMLLTAVPTAAPMQADAANDLIVNDCFWKDTSGNNIYSQGGGIFKFGDTYYWYGVHYKGAETYAAKPFGKNSDTGFVSVTCYSSQDLVNWKFENDVLTPRSKGFGFCYWAGRLGVAYCPKSKQYVLVMQYNESVLFASASTPTGNFEVKNIQDQIQNVQKQGTGDQTIFVDDDGVDDIKNHTYTEEVPIENGELLIKPKDIIITTSQEVVRITSEFIGILSGRSSVARLGVMVQCCQELIQPGHGQTIPLQLINLGENTVRLPVNVAVCQLALIKLRTPSSGAYSTKEGAKYKDEVGPMDSRLYEEIDQVQVESTRGEKEIALAIEKTNEAKEEERKKKKRFWSSLICPVLASVIAALFSSALVVNTLNGKTVSGVLYRIGTFLGNIPLVVICIILLFVAYFFFTKWGTQ